jgi:hypothetical protein
MELLSQGLTSTLAGSTQQDEHSMDDSSTYGVEQYIKTNLLAYL